MNQNMSLRFNFKSQDRNVDFLIRKDDNYMYKSRCVDTDNQKLLWPYISNFVELRTIEGRSCKEEDKWLLMWKTRLDFRSGHISAMLLQISISG